MDRPDVCPSCGSTRIWGIDYEYEEEIGEDVPNGWECEDCGACSSLFRPELSTCAEPYDGPKA